MREHKYRAWDKVNNIMFNACFVGIGKVFSMTKTFKPSKQLENVIVMQYTGLKDKNGVEIYEGDIVADKETVMSDMGEDKPNYVEKRIVKNFEYAGGQVGERRYGREIFTVKWEVISCGFEPFSDSLNNCGHCGGGLDANRVEVIGNIYKNPELLDKD
jgi:uncharacterized phage protein (TIGR01671 family)